MIHDIVSGTQCRRFVGGVMVEGWEVVVNYRFLFEVNGASSHEAAGKVTIHVHSFLIKINK